MSPQEIEVAILGRIDCERCEVNGDGYHFEALVVSAAFVGMRTVARQQRVYAVLKDLIASGDLHAISMKTLTPEEFAQREAGHAAI